jgi:hypothetical protein
MLIFLDVLLKFPPLLTHTTLTPVGWQEIKSTLHLVFVSSTWDGDTKAFY